MKHTIYRNKRNTNKYIEVATYKCRHTACRQIIIYENGVKYYVGDGKLHRVNKTTLCDVLEDYGLYGTIDKEGEINVF